MYQQRRGDSSQGNCFTPHTNGHGFQNHSTFVESESSFNNLNCSAAVLLASAIKSRTDAVVTQTTAVRSVISKS